MYHLIKQFRATHWALLLLLGFASRDLAQTQGDENTNQPARLCIALAQPGENETVAWKQGKPMWKKPAYPGYSMGEYTLPAGQLGLELRHPLRPPLTINNKLLAGKCYLLVVDKKPNQDPKTQEQYPMITDTHWIELPWGKPSGQSAIFAYGAGPNPITLRPNDKTINLPPGQVTKISDGYALLSDSAGNPLMDFNPTGDTFFLLVLFSDSSGKLAPIRCHYY